MSAPLETTKAAVELTVEVMKAAGDCPQVRRSSTNLGYSAVTVTETINTVLLPIAALNFAFKKARAYFEQQFQKDLQEKAAQIPVEHVVEPKASIAGPALQGLAFTHEEPNLKEMYLNLLATAMDGRVASGAHPAFVEVIKQLNSAEADLVRGVLRSPVTAIAQVRQITKGVEGWTVMLDCLLNLRKQGTQEAVEEPSLPSMVDNWVRLGLCTVDFDRYQTLKDAYAWVEGRPEYKRLKDMSDGEVIKVTFQKGVIARTSFGVQFAEAVGLKL